MIIELNSAKDIFEYFNLEEHSKYLVDVKVSINNIEHRAILFTGFKNGNYCVVYTNSYDAPIKMEDLYFMRIIKKI